MALISIVNYLSILVDRETGKTSFVASTEGGVDIEAVAHETPELTILSVSPPATAALMAC